jgi:hypothetical protein
MSTVPCCCYVTRYLNQTPPYKTGQSCLFLVKGSQWLPASFLHAASNLIPVLMQGSFACLVSSMLRTSGCACCN